jgi:hypothetical protein
MKNLSKLTTALFILIIGAAGCNKNTSDKPKDESNDSLRHVIDGLSADVNEVYGHLATFDTLDYIVFTNQEWGRIHESHASDVKVNWPDGHFTTGIEKHIDDLKAMFVYAPNTSIKQHPFRFGQDNITCNGKFINPTGKSFSIPMCTIGIWAGGVMIEEYLYWDNQAYMNQMGLGKQ